jgi:hypothetical protein
MYFPDRDSKGGGILAYINTDFPVSRKTNLESETLENISVEVHINKNKWLVKTTSTNDGIQFFIKHVGFKTNCEKSRTSQISFPDIENLSISSEVHNVYNEYQNAFKSVLDKYAPVKNRQPRKNPLPCVNSELRGAIYSKHMVLH